jgi:hypothetical protein
MRSLTAYLKTPLGLIMTFIKNLILVTTLLASSLNALNAISAPSQKAYSEIEFLDTFSGKSSKVILDHLGKPNKKELSIKPSNANKMLVGRGKESSKPVKVEMWYYNNRVNYAPNKTYKFTELTFVNDRCMNIAFFNNR